MKSAPESTEPRRYSTTELVMLLEYTALKMVVVPPTHGLTKIAAMQQHNVTKMNLPFSFIEVSRQIYKEGGARGFLDGMVPSALREGSKASYKGIVQVYAKELSTRMISLDSNGCYLLRGIIAGGIVGIVEPFIGGPIERYRTYKVRHGKNTNFFKFYNEILGNKQHNSVFAKLYELNRGLGVTIGRQLLTNIAFFTTYEWADYTLNPYKNDYPKITMGITSLAAATSAALIGAPLDVAKTLIQQETGHKKEASEILNFVWKQRGWRGLFAGLPIRFCMISIGFGINALFIKMFEQIRAKPQFLINNQDDSKSNDIDGLSNELSALSISSPTLLMRHNLQSTNCERIKLESQASESDKSASLCFKAKF